MSAPTLQPAPQQVRLVIADDHPAFCSGLRYLLEMEADLKVVGEASNGADAVTMVRQLKPDILLLDDRMPEHSGQPLSAGGMYALRELSSPANPTPVRVILFPAEIEKSQIAEALQLGARGVVLKIAATEELLKAIQTVMAGEYWVQAKQFSNLTQCLQDVEAQEKNVEARQRKFGLTPRELEIVSAVVAGYSNKEIAEYFKVSEDTVKHHLSNVFDKLGVSTRRELALFAVNQRLPLKPSGIARLLQKLGKVLRTWRWK